MILVGNQRGGAKDLARHLLKEENESVEVHELRYFASTSLGGALNEAYALSRATKCKQYLFSLSLNPPPGESVETGDFEEAINRVEDKLGLSRQPRAIVFHIKGGRTHAHAVWSRIDVNEMKAVQLSFSKRKLMDVGRELYLKHGWQMPRGLVSSQERNPLNFTLAEWQHAKRIGKDPREIKAALQDCWAISDSRAAFEAALKERGFWLARGDKRGFVAIDFQGEIFSVPRWVGVKTKDVRSRLGSEDNLLSVDEAKIHIADAMRKKLGSFEKELSVQRTSREVEQKQRQTRLINKQRDERHSLRTKQSERQNDEARRREARYSKGLRGLWDRLRGEHRRIRIRNEWEVALADMRDRSERSVLLRSQAQERLQLSLQYQASKEEERALQGHLKEEAKSYEAMIAERRESVTRRRRNRSTKQGKSQTPGHGMGQ